MSCFHFRKLNKTSQLCLYEVLLPFKVVVNHSVPATDTILVIIEQDGVADRHPNNYYNCPDDYFIQSAKK